MSKELTPIQNHIISKLKNAKTLRYSEMQPAKVPNDLYNYHLQFLVKKGLVWKLEDGYSLSPAGIKRVADINTSNDTLTSLFKINVITILVRKNGKKIEVLNQIRKSNPSYGKVGVMGGVVRKGELTEVAATRKLKQETGLIADFKVVGCERRIMYKEGELFSDVLFPIAVAFEHTGDLINTEFGENFWVPIDQAIKNESDPYDSIKGITAVLNAIKSNKLNKLPFFYTEEIKSDLTE